jgi:type I restriction enzyme S subunit
MRVKLKDIGKIVTGKTPSKREESFWDSDDIPFVKPDDFKNDVSLVDKFNTYVSFKGSEKANIVPPNSVLVTCIGTIGKVIINNLEVTTNQQINSIIPNENIDAKYLMYQILTKKAYLNHIANAPVVPIINKTTFGNIEINIHPLKQQKAIAKKLDLAKELIELRKASIEKLDVLAKSVFIDMFGDPVENEMGWDIFNLNEVSNKITDGEHGTVARLESGKMYLMARNISKFGKLDFTTVSYISEESHNKIFKRCNTEYNDLLLVCVGATIGKCCLVPKMESFSLARSVALIKPSTEKINPSFLLNFFNIESIQRELKKASNASAQAGLYTGMIKKIKIIVPPINLQNKFAKTIQKIETQKALYEQELLKMEEVFESLLGRVFSPENTDKTK